MFYDHWQVNTISIAWWNIQFQTTAEDSWKKAIKFTCKLEAKDEQEFHFLNLDRKRVMKNHRKACYGLSPRHAHRDFILGCQSFQGNWINFAAIVFRVSPTMLASKGLYRHSTRVSRSGSRTWTFTTKLKESITEATVPSGQINICSFSS